MNYVLGWEAALAEITAPGTPYELTERDFGAYQVPSLSICPAIFLTSTAPPRRPTATKPSLFTKTRA